MERDEDMKKICSKCGNEELELLDNSKKISYCTKCGSIFIKREDGVIMMDYSKIKMNAYLNLENVSKKEESGTMMDKNRGNAIINIIEIVPNKVAKVVFYDGTIEKVVCDEDDTFSLEMAITICMAKKLYGGTAAYNKAVRDGMKIYKRMLERKQNEKEERERIAKKKQKRKEYLARREARRREEQIEIQKEAYVRAMKELNDDASTVGA
jgi:hypothetical protein